jgi:hypothetical protein
VVPRVERKVSDGVLVADEPFLLAQDRLEDVEDTKDLLLVTFPQR